MTIVRTYYNGNKFNASDDRMFLNFNEAITYIENMLKQGKKAVIL